MRDCAVCSYLRLEPRAGTGTIGLNTAVPELIAAAVQRLDAGIGPNAHILLPVCPEHVVDIYRGRVDGVSMAWRLAVAGS